MIKASFHSTDAEVVQRLTEKGPRIVAALLRQMNLSMIKLQAHIVADKLQGQVLHHRSGKLAASVRPILAHPVGTGLYAEVQAGGGPAWYGRIHEYGGVYTYLRENRKRGVGTYVTATFPQRSFARSAMEDQRTTIMAGIRDAVRKAATTKNV